MKRKNQDKVVSSNINSESRSVQGVIRESADTIAKVFKRGGNVYSSTVFSLAQQDLQALKKNKKQVLKLSGEIEDLRDDIFYFIKSLDESSVSASNFYIQILGFLQDMTQSLDYITNLSHKHVNNNHKKLKFSQIKELSEISSSIELLFNQAKDTFESNSYDNIAAIVNLKSEILRAIDANLNLQIKRTRSEESSPKNTTLYFSLLLETKDLLLATSNLLNEYSTSYNRSLQ